MMLRECGFCANFDQSKLREFRVGDLRAVECAVCGAHGPMKRTSLDAQLAWNERSADLAAPRQA